MYKTVDEFLKSDRQWPRHLRIAHARHQLSVLDKRDDTARHFWQQVLERNQD